MSDLLVQIQQIQAQGHGGRVYRSGGEFGPCLTLRESKFSISRNKGVITANPNVKLKCKLPAQVVAMARSAHSSKMVPAVRPIVRLT